MANTSLQKSQIEEGISKVTSYSNGICSQLTELYSIVNNVKEYYQTNSGLVSFIDNLSDTLKSVTNDYGTYRDEFLKTLQDIISTYELEDSRTSMSISQLDGKTVASMSIGAGAFSAGASGFDFGKISRNAGDVANGNFIDESNVHNSAFGEGEYTFQYREDGTVRIDKNGVPMAFTTKENADKITGGINTGTTNSAMNNDPRYQYNPEEDGGIANVFGSAKQVANSEAKINGEASKQGTGGNNTTTGTTNSAMNNDPRYQYNPEEDGGIANVFGSAKQVANSEAKINGEASKQGTSGNNTTTGTNLSGFNPSLGNVNEQPQTPQNGLTGIPASVLEAAGVSSDSVVVSTEGTIPAFENVFKVNEKMMNQASGDNK